MIKSMSTRLRNRVEVWGRKTALNALGETDGEEQKLAALWCDIVPKSGRVEQIGDVPAAIYESITHEVTFRRSAAKQLSEKYHLRIGDERLEIQYIMPHYNEPDKIVAYCREVNNL